MILKHISFWIALSGVAAVTLLVYKTTAVAPFPEPPIEPSVKPTDRIIAAAGVVEALRENTSVGVPVAALVKRVHVAVWDSVEAGMPLIDLDDRDLQAKLLTQQAELTVRQKEMEMARRLHERTAALRSGNGVSQDEADRRQDEYHVARARLDAAHAALAETQSLIGRLTVRAPVSGTVLQVNTREGEYLTPGASTPPMLLGAISEVQVRADVDEQLAPRVLPGSSATGFLKGDTRNPIAMEFVRIEPFVVPKQNLTGSSGERVDTRVLQVIFRFSNEGAQRIYVGQQIDVYIEEGAQR